MYVPKYVNTTYSSLCLYGYFFRADRLNCNTNWCALPWEDYFSQPAHSLVSHGTWFRLRPHNFPPFHISTWTGIILFRPCVGSHVARTSWMESLTLSFAVFYLSQQWLVSEFFYQITAELTTFSIFSSWINISTDELH